MVSLLLGGGRTKVLIRAALIAAAIAFTDWRVEGNFQLGFLYLLPMLLVGAVLSVWQIATVAAACTALTEVFDSFEWSGYGVARDVFIFSAFFCAGLFVFEFTRSRRRIEGESEARREAEEQLQVLVESSPAAILTTDSEGRILLANDASHRLFGVDAFSGKSVRDYLPALGNVTALDRDKQSFRTMMQCRGRREDGEVFLADVWFSTYRTTVGPRLAAMVVDASEELRNREELGLHQLLAGSRILVGAVSHEVRNVCGAIAVVHENLARGGALARNKDFETLGTLILALEKIAATDLRKMADQASEVDLPSLLEELRIVVDSSLRDAGVEVRWEIDTDLPPVWADRQSLMQVFLNLVKNSERAMLNEPVQRLTISARANRQQVLVRVQDTGCGVPHPERLFRPFQQEARATGLGLYLSRAFMRSFRGDLRYEAETNGSSFIVELSTTPGGNENYGSDSFSGRSQPVSGEPQPAAPGRT